MRVGYIDGKYVVNPTYEQLEESLIDIVVAGTKNAIMMVEAGADEAPEDIILGALEYGQEQNQILIELQEEMVAALQARSSGTSTPVAVPDGAEEARSSRTSPATSRSSSRWRRTSGRARSTTTRRRSSRSTARSTARRPSARRSTPS